MGPDNQSAVIDFLGRPSTHGGAPVERIDTHAAVVFLAGTRAWKLKRAVRYDYLDFSTTELRREFCNAEVHLNRRTAPAIYRGVVAVTRERDGSLALGGSGVAIDWVVEMTRFDQAALFDRLAASGNLDLALMSALGSAIARFHQAAERRADHGGRAGMGWVLEGNVAGFAEYGSGALDPSACRRLNHAARTALVRRGAQLDDRRSAGFVRQCHGDLHLRNIVLLEGRPTLFDAIEFNDEIACVDVLYDLAFLLMDLWRRQLPRHANAVWNSYLGETDDLDGLALMPLFLSCRAAVRAKTSATAAHLQKDERRAGELRELAREYLVMAERLLQPPPPSLIAIGGLSGSGKSTLAKALAPSVGGVPGAVILRSDEIRKRLCGVPPFERLGPEGYTSEVSARVYETIVERAARVLRGGQTGIVDAVYAPPADRQSIERVAAAANVPFVGLWLDAPEDTLIQRTERRRRDASDADAAVVRTQRRQDVGAISWHRIDAALSPAAVVNHAETYMKGVGTQGSADLSPIVALALHEREKGRG